MQSSMKETCNIHIHRESKKLGHFFTAYNFRNVKQVFTIFGTNLNIVLEFIQINFGK